MKASKDKKRPIGIFDSGLGGLTCVKPIAEALPDERIIYFGDTARTPYGSKSPETVRSFALQVAEYLLEQDCKMLAIACNTISSVAADYLGEMLPDTPIVGIIKPAAREIAELYEYSHSTGGDESETDSRPEGGSRSIGIIGTKVTIYSKAYEKEIHAISPNANIHSVACPALVPLIEEGIIESKIMDLTIAHYLDEFIEYHEIDTLVLGCTHYPLVRGNIEKLYPNLKIIDPAESMAGEVKAVLESRNLLSESKDEDDIFLASDLSENFMNMINRLACGAPFKVGVQKF